VDKRNSNRNILAFSLGLEELAMAMGLINRPDIGRELMLSTYPDLSDEEIDSRLTSSSHSLLARGLCTISDGRNMPTLDSDLEQVLLPLIRFDYLLQMSVVREETSVNASVHVLKDNTFTSHAIYSGVIHVLEYTAYRELANYLQDVFEEFGEDGPLKIENAPINLGVIGRVLEKSADGAQAESLLVEAGWKKADAKKLVQDMDNQVFRATILRIKATHETPLEELKDIPTRSLLLLMGKKRSWLGEFSSTADNAKGTLQLVDKQTFYNKLKEFVE